MCTDYEKGEWWDGVRALHIREASGPWIFMTWSRMLWNWLWDSFRTRWQFLFYLPVTCKSGLVKVACNYFHCSGIRFFSTVSKEMDLAVTSIGQQNNLNMTLVFAYKKSWSTNHPHQPVTSTAVPFFFCHELRLSNTTKMQTNSPAHQSAPPPVSYDDAVAHPFPHCRFNFLHPRVFNPNKPFLLTAQK